MPSGWNELATVDLMENEEVKPSEVKPTIRSGKLSLRKRRKDKRNKDGRKEVNESGRKRQRVPIPSFSPLDENCDIIGKPDTSSTSRTPPNNSKPKMEHTSAANDENRNMNNLPSARSKKTRKILHISNNGEDIPRRDTSNELILKQDGMSSNLTPDAPMSTLPKLNDQTQEDTINPVLVDSSSVVAHSKEIINVDDSKTEKHEEISSNVEVRVSSKLAQEKSMPTKTVTNDQPQIDTIKKSKDCTAVIHLRVRDGTDGINTNSNKTVAKAIHVQFASKPKGRQTKGGDSKPINEHSDNEIEIIGSSSLNNDRQDTIQKPVGEAIPSHPLIPQKQRKSTRSKTSKTASTTNNALKLGTAVGSPSLDDFNVSRGKLLNDKEIDLKRQHADLLDISKNGKVQNNRAPRRRRTQQIIAKGATSKLCTLCSTCSCSRGSALQSLEDSAISEHQNPLQRLARSEAEVERALIGRLSRLEKSASWFDHLCTKASRELKRHRNKIKARMQQGNGASRPKFLRDVDADDERQFSAPAISTSFVNRAKHQIFSFRKSESTHPSIQNTSSLNICASSNSLPVCLEAQPTLTQMLRDSEDEATDNDDGAKTLETIQEEDEQVGESDKDDQVGDTTEETKEDFVNYGDACFRGKTRSLWKASRMTEDQLQESNLKQDFDQTEVNESANMNSYKTSSGCHVEQDFYDDGLSELLHVFDHIDDDESAAMDDIDILGAYGKDLYDHQANQPDGYGKDLNDPTTMSQLSPVAKSAFASMAIKVESDPQKMEMLDAECPNWKENLRFSLRQSPHDLQGALANVQEKQKRIAKAMEMLKKQATVLEVFEMALTDSLERCDDCNNLVQEDLISHL